MHLVLHSPKWSTNNLLSTNELYVFANILFKTFYISKTFSYWWQIVVSSACKYVWLFDWACGSFTYNRNMVNTFINSGSIIDHYETPQFIIPVSKRHYLMKRKKLCMWDRSKIIILLFYLKNLSILFNQI